MSNIRDKRVRSRRGGGIPETPGKEGRVGCVEVREGTVDCVTAYWDNNWLPKSGLCE